MALVQVCLAFVGIFLIPGYFCARLVGCPKTLLDPRTLSYSCLLGLAVVTQSAYAVFFLIGFNTPAVWLTALTVTVVALLAQRFTHPREQPFVSVKADGVKIRRGVFLFAGLIVFLAICAQSSFGIGERLYFPDGLRDYLVRVETVQTFLKTGVPPKNTFSGFGEQPVLVYHYFFYLICAILSLVANAPATLAWSFGTGISTALFFAFAFEFAKTASRSSRVAALTLLLMFCGGFDTLMMAVSYLWERFHNGWRPPVPHSIFEIEDYWVGNPHVSSFMTLVAAVPHHILSFASTLCLLILIERRRYTISAFLLAFLLCTSSGIGIVAALGLVIVTAIAAFQKQWKLCLRLVGMGLFSLFLMAPYLFTLAKNSSQTQLKWALRSVETVYGGALFSHYLGVSTLTKFFDLALHYFLEFGVLLVLAALGFRLLRKQEVGFFRTLLLSFAGSSFFIMLFARTPTESMAINSAMPFMYAVVFCAALWILENWRSLSKRRLLKVALSMTLVAQFTVALWIGFWILRYNLRPVIRQAAEREYTQKVAIEKMDALVKKPSYRVQVLPPWRNLGNDTLSARIPLFSGRAQVLYVSDGAVYYGVNRSHLDNYLEGLCSIYSGDLPKLRAGLAAFDFNTTSMTAPWFSFMQMARRCFNRNSDISLANLREFTHQQRVDFLLLEPTQKNATTLLSELKAIGLPEPIELGAGLLLVDVQKL